jgi:1-acyl-sn-glycerol-3-phosphate acyltransferase
MEIAFSAVPMGRVERVVRLTRGLGVALAIFVFWSCALGFAWLLVPYAHLREREPLARRRRIQRVVARAFRWFLRMLEVTTLYRSAYSEADAAPLRDLGPVMLVANHPTLLDVTVILARTPEACCLVKNSLMNNPLVGRLLRACGHVAAGDGTLEAGLEVLEAMRARLHDGFSVLIFPEGTRSPEDGLHKFRRGAFVIAQRAGVPVVPLFLRCDPPALGKGTPVWRHPRRCPTLTVHVGLALDTNGVGANELCKSVERDFRCRVNSALHSAALSGKQGT